MHIRGRIATSDEIILLIENKLNFEDTEILKLSHFILEKTSSTIPS